MKRTVEVVNYNPDWPKMFIAARDDLNEVLGKDILEIHHIGSTAVRGISAKPIIDMLAVVNRIEVADNWKTDLNKLRYNTHGEYGIPGRRFFSRDTGGKRTHHLHVFAEGNPQIKRHLQFRDSLKANPGVKRYYSRLKESLAAKFPEDIESYIKGKKDFIDKIVMDNRLTDQK